MSQMILQLIVTILSFILLIIAYITGRIIEKKHYKSIQQREIELIRKPIITYGAKKWTPTKNVKTAYMVTGEVVVSGDRFKSFFAGIKTLFGGRLTSYESVIDRARREAILRMRKKAVNADIIVNVRIENIMLNSETTRCNTTPQCAIIAYGTAVTYE